MNEQNSNFNGITDEEIELLAKRSRKTKTLIVAIFAAALVIAIACAIIPGFFGEESEEQYETYPPVHPSLLHDTKEEGFDIMEYEEYLALNRQIMYVNGDSKTGITSKDAHEWGEDIKLAYDIIGYIIAGDVDAYNSSVSDKLEKESFTQQQLYSISLSKAKVNTDDDYDYAVRVEYKIHENNGSYRDNIEPDASRYQIYYMKKVDGKLTVTDIVEPFFKK